MFSRLVTCSKKTPMESRGGGPAIRPRRPSPNTERVAETPSPTPSMVSTAQAGEAGRPGRGGKHAPRGDRRCQQRGALRVQAPAPADGAVPHRHRNRDAGPGAHSVTRYLADRAGRERRPAGAAAAHRVIALLGPGPTAAQRLRRVRRGGRNHVDLRRGGRRRGPDTPRSSEKATISSFCASVALR